VIILKGLTVAIPYVEKASRLELFVRIPYMIAYAIIVSIFAIIAIPCWFIQIFGILILGKRFETLNKIVLALIKYMVGFQVYFYTLTDEKPNLIPEV
jgi:hypothetical protein